MDFSQVKEWMVPEGRVRSVSVNGILLWQSMQQLTEPTISLSGDILTVTATDSKTQRFGIYVNGKKKATINCSTEGLAYTLSDDGTYAICSGIGTATATDIVISNEYEGVPVQSIDNSAFYERTSLTSVIIPDSVQSIGEYAFASCTSLMTVEISNSVQSIGDYAFSFCNSLTSVVIPNSVQTIGGYAFAWCASLTSVEIGDSAQTIGNSAFEGCNSLTSVKIGDSAQTIGNSAFAWCTSLTEVYYKGTASDWSAITIGLENDDLTYATRYYYSEEQPTGSGNYWHYVDGVVTKW